MKAVIVIGNNYKFNPDDFNDAFIIGVDKGALFCQQNKIYMDLAIGDFDSITFDDLKNTSSKNIIKLNPIKDQTDTREALGYCMDYDEIIILGGIQGKRIEHFYANLLLLSEYPNLKIKDDYSFIFTASKDLIIENNDYKYVSIFAIEDKSIISLQGFKYELDKYNLKRNDPLCISNEILKKGEIKIDNGRIMIILSREDRLWNPFTNI